MKSAIAIRHVAFEDLGSFLPALHDRGYSIAYHDAGVDDPGDPALREAELLIALGGPISVNDENNYPFLTGELAAIRFRLAAQRPTLGICLGAQLIAKALGSRVYAAPRKEIGWSKLLLSAAGEHSPLALLQDAPVLHWHGETFDLPEEAIHLASTPVCLNQAFAIGHHALGLQFHPEITRLRFEQWLIGHVGEINAAGLSVARLRKEASYWCEDLDQRSRLCLSAWLELAEIG